VIYDNLGRHADAEAELAKLKAAQGDSSAYQYATIYAQWGNRAKALEWLETTLRLRDPGLVLLMTDPLMDPLRKEPRFQAIERELKFPSAQDRLRSVRICAIRSIAFRPSSAVDRDAP